MPKPVVALVAVVAITATAILFLRSTPDPAPLPVPSDGGTSREEPKVDFTPVTPREVVKVSAAGRVITEAGDPSADVTVRCERGIGDLANRQFEAVGTTITSAAGDFAYPDLPVGRYRFTVNETGYAAAEAIVVLAEGVTSEPIELVLTPGSVIEGTIYDQLGSPLAGAEIVAFDERGREDDSVQDRVLRLLQFEDMKTEVGISAVSRTDGTYTVRGLDKDRYRVRVRGTGHASEERRYVPSGSREIDFNLQGGGRLIGLVTAVDDSPIAGATISLRQFNDTPDVIERVQERTLPPIAQTLSNPEGEFLFDTVGGGKKYALWIEAKGFQPREVEPIVVNEGADTQERIQLAAGYVIQGIALDPGGTALAGARCTLQRNANRTGSLTSNDLEDLKVTTDSSGEFVFDTLENGPYTLLVTHDEYASFLERAAMPSESGEDRIQAVLTVGAAVQGRVLEAETETPIAGAVVSTPDRAGNQRSAVTNAEGEYDLRGITPPRRSRITLSASRESFEPQSGKSVTVVEGSTTSGIDFHLRRNGAISGIVYDHFDTPVEGVRILARRAIRASGGVATVADMTVSDDRGRFFLPQVTPGTGTILEGSHPDFVDGLSEPLIVEPDVELTGVVLRMKIGGELSGRIVDSDGTPISGATIGAIEDQMSITDPQSLPSSVITAEDGEFVLRRLSPGDVTILAAAPGYLGTRMSKLRVFEAERTANVVVKLTTGAKISGFVRDTSGAPIEDAKVIAIDTSFGLQKFTQTTDEDGAFLFDALGQYPVELEATAKGHGKLRLHEQAVNQTGVVMTLESYGAIRGRVVTSDGEPLPTYNVSPRFIATDGRALPRVPSRTFTSETFDFGGLVPGTYEIIIGSRGLAPAVLENVVVKPKRFTELPLATLQQGGKVIGVVYEKTTGFALPDTTITVIGGAENYHHDGTTAPPRPSARDRIPISPEGQFEIKGLFYDSVTLKFEHPGVITRIFDVQVGVTDLAVAMMPGGEIEGVVAGPGGSVINAMQVLLSGEDGFHDQSATTDRRGQFRFIGLPPGEYTLQVTQRSRGELSKGNAGKIQTFTATVEPGETTIVDLYYD